MNKALVNFKSGINKPDRETYYAYIDNEDGVTDNFGLKELIKDAIESYKLLVEKFDAYILSTSTWNNSN